MKAAREFAVVVGVDLKCGEVDADGSGVADGRCTTHLQITDGRPDFALCFEMEVLGAVREFRLVDDDEGALAVVEGDGFHGENICVHCVPLFVILWSYFSENSRGFASIFRQEIMKMSADRRINSLTFIGNGL